MAELLPEADKPLAATPGHTRRGDCVAVLTPERLVVAGGGIDRVYELDELTTAVVVPTSSGSAFFPALTSSPGDMFLADGDVANFAAAVRARLLELRPPTHTTPIWERADFVATIRLEEAGLLTTPRSCAIPSRTLIVVTITAAGVQMREREGETGMVVPWFEIRGARVEGVDQVQTRPNVGAVIAFGVLGLAARRTDKRAYMTLEVDDGEYLIEDALHLPVELRSMLSPFVAHVEGPPTGLTGTTRWDYQHLIGDVDESDVWARLTELGHDGWDAVGVTSAGGRVVILLKRQALPPETLIDDTPS